MDSGFDSPLTPNHSLQIRVHLCPSVANKTTKWPILATLFILTACGSQTHWYKAGHTQRDFAVDTRQCELVATELAREASITKQKPNIQIYADQYAACLMARGWSPGVPPAITANPPASEVKPSPAFIWPAVTIDPEMGSVSAYGIRFRLPKTFRLLSQAKVPSPLTLKQNFLWGGEKNDFLFFSVQQSLGRVEFQDTPYPLSNNNDFIYDQGRLHDQGLPWRAFCSPRNGRQIGLVGIILRRGKSRRIMVVASTTLPDGLPEDGSHTRLTTGQHIAMADFTDNWAAWFAQTIPPSGISWKIPFSPLDMIGQRER